MASRSVIIAVLAVSATASADDERDVQAVVGIDLGVAGATGVPGDVFGPAIGLQVVLGARHDDLAVEVHAGLGYGTAPKQTALQGATTRGTYDLRSLVVRWYCLPGEILAVSVFGGIASASVPLLALGADPDNTAVVQTMDVSGTGATFGATAHYPLRRHLELVGELAVAAILWELPGHAYVQPMPAATDPAMSTTITAASGDISSIPWSFSIGLRAEL